MQQIHVANKSRVLTFLTYRNSIGHSKHRKISHKTQDYMEQKIHFLAGVDFGQVRS